MRRKRVNCIWLLAFLLLTLVGCGGSGSGGSDDSDATGLNQGVIVDPYISGAVLQEISSDGTTVLQRASSVSDEMGRFKFDNPVQPGSIIETKISSLGTHAGADNKVILRRKVLLNDDGVMVVSPLTTLIANGSSENELVDLMQTAGLADFHADHIYQDPMDGLVGSTSAFSTDHLVRLQAAMAISSYLEATGNPAATAMDLNDLSEFQILSACVDIVKETMDPDLFNQFMEDPDITGLTADDFVHMAVVHNRPVVSMMESQLTQEGQIDPESLRNESMAASNSMMVEIMEQHQSQGPGSADGEALYAENCAFCHGALAETDVPGFSATGIQSAIDQNMGGMGSLSNLTTDEVQAIATVLPTAPTTPPVDVIDGSALYSSDCAICHGSLDNTDISSRSAGAIQSAIDQNIGGMGLLSDLTTEEVQAIADSLPSSTPVDPTLPVDGSALYSSECAGCHNSLDNTNINNRTATAIQSAIDMNTGNMGFLSTLTTEEVQAIADAMPEPAPVDPTQPLDGASLYSNNCAICHGAIDSSNISDRTAGGIQTAIDQNIGGMASLSDLTPEAVQAIADAMPVVSGPTGPDYSNCTSCHAQPPNGTTEPNIDGAHSAHQAIASIGTDCQICHTDATHNGFVDLAFPVVYNSASGAALDNMDGTCSNISCHGGQTSPDWWTETIDLQADCISCHQPDSNEYTSNTSGRHRKHSRYSCTACHNTDTMPTHIGDLSTTTFEITPASTVGGDNTMVGSYSNNTCSTVACHGSEGWR